MRCALKKLGIAFRRAFLQIERMRRLRRRAVSQGERRLRHGLDHSTIAVFQKEIVDAEIADAESNAALQGSGRQTQFRAPGDQRERVAQASEAPVSCREPHSAVGLIR